MNFKSVAVAAMALMVIAPNAFARKKDKKQETPEGYKFEIIYQNPITPVKDQNRSGTCWAFSGISFFESEILKAGYQGDLDLAEMFIVNKAYGDKGEKFVRLHGNLNFGPGSSFGDVLAVLKAYGIVPESVMGGLNYGFDKHVHGEMDNILSAYVNAVIKNGNGKLSPVWKKGYQGVLDAYLGQVPETFQVNGIEYTPKTYMESLGIDLNNYVDLTSFTHHPFYEKMVIEVPDNWRWEEAYNVPIDDLIAIIDNALANGYTLAWASDVSEIGFNRKGLGIVPDEDATVNSGSDQARWVGLTPQQRKDKFFEAPIVEREITQEMRQEGYDNYQTTDDHGMHIFGMAKDQNGTKYYMVKNSWGLTGDYEGIWYVSEAFVRYKTMDIMINKNAIPAEIRGKMNL